MISIAYVSSATVACNETKLLDLVAQCQRNNEKLGVTGILVYSDGKERGGVPVAKPCC